MYHWTEYHGAGERLLLPLADARGNLPEPGDPYTAFEYHWIVRSPDGPYVPDWLWEDYVKRCESARQEAIVLLEKAHQWVESRKAFWAAYQPSRIRGRSR